LAGVTTDVTPAIVHTLLAGELGLNEVVWAQAQAVTINWACITLTIAVSLDGHREVGLWSVSDVEGIDEPTEGVTESHGLGSAADVVIKGGAILKEHLDIAE
jgi:hypothetical protein